MGLLQRQTSVGSPGSAGEVITLVLMVVATLAVIVKVLSKLLLVHKFQMDDTYIVLSLASAVAYTVVLCVEVSAGLGRGMSTMSATQKHSFSKAIYTNGILYVVSICLAKLAALAFLITLSGDPIRRFVSRGVIALNLLVCSTTVIALIFQCDMPKPWNIIEGDCFDQVALWIAFGILDVVTDVMIIGLPIYLLKNIQISARRRNKALAAFFTRIVLVPVVIVRLVYIVRSYRSEHQQYREMATTIITSVHISVSIFTTCVPFMKPVSEGLQSGIFKGRISSFERSSHGHPLRDVSGSGTSHQGLTDPRLKPCETPPNQAAAVGVQDEQFCRHSNSQKIRKDVSYSVEFEPMFRAKA